MWLHPLAVNIGGLLVSGGIDGFLILRGGVSYGRMCSVRLNILPSLFSNRYAFGSFR